MAVPLFKMATNDLGLKHLSWIELTPFCEICYINNARYLKENTTLAAVRQLSQLQDNVFSATRNHHLLNVITPMFKQTSSLSFEKGYW